MKNLKFNNSYYFKVIDTKTKQIKQEIKTHNIVLNTFWEEGALKYNNLQFLSLGSGTTEPKIEDKTLEHILWRGFVLERTSCKKKRREEIIDGKTVLKTIFTITFFVDTTVTGTISEVGFVNKYGDIAYTRALLKDDEGNLTPIKKTIYDDIEITVLVSYYYDPEDKRPFAYVDDRLRDFFCDNNDSNKGFLSKPIENPQMVFASRKKNTRLYDEDSPGLDTLYDEVRSCATSPYDLKTHTLNYSSRLISTKDIRYFNEIGIRYLGYYYFPNHEIFVPQLLSNMKIGVGDGSTLEYKCPLNYFIKDTDKVYKNGVLLTRDVDYTIDNENNQDMLIELSFGNLAYWAMGQRTDSNEKFDRMSLFKYHCYQANYPPYKPWIEDSYFDKNHPFKLMSKKPIKCNTIRFVPNFPVGTYTISYLDNQDPNGATYIPVAKIERTDSAKIETHHFKTAISDEWKIETTAEGVWMCPTRKFEEDSPLKDRNKQPFFGYVGKGITFTQPPEEGAILTMDAQNDIPFIDKDHFLDFSLSILVGGK